MADFKTGDDPADHTVEEVVSWLDQADDTERARVLEAEAAGKNRVSLAGYLPPTIAAEDEAPAAMTPEEALAAAVDAVQAKHQAAVAESTEE
jgi:hypothetical protein